MENSGELKMMKILGRIALSLKKNKITGKNWA